MPPAAVAPTASTPVIVDSCSGNRQQQWSKVGTQLSNDMSGLCLTSSAAGEPLTTEKCKVAANQNWRLPPSQH
jgi:hypothetical protein